MYQPASAKLCLRRLRVPRKHLHVRTCSVPAKHHNPKTHSETSLPKTTVPTLVNSPAFSRDHFTVNGPPRFLRFPQLGRNPRTRPESSPRSSATVEKLPRQKRFHRRTSRARLRPSAAARRSQAYREVPNPRRHKHHWRKTPKSWSPAEASLPPFQSRRRTPALLHRLPSTRQRRQQRSAADR